MSALQLLQNGGTTTAQIAFFSDALRNASVHEGVRIGADSYAVYDGVVYENDRPVRGVESLPALRLAYTKALARRSPLLGIAGTDPVRLRGETDRLSAVAMRLADEQTDPANALLVGTSLYPVSFLRALADLESAREVFLDTGSSDDAMRYEQLLDIAIRTGAADSARFEAGFERATQGLPTRAKLLSLAGTVTRESQLASLATVRMRFSEVAARATARTRCAAGELSECDADDVALPPLAHTDAPQGGGPHAPAYTLVSTTLPTALSSRLLVQINASACVGTQAGPYVFLTERPEIGPRFLPDIYVGKLFFVPTKMQTGASVLTYLRDVHGTDYIFTNPTNYYQCPEAGVDISAMRSTIDAYSLDGSVATIKLPQLLRESDARRALSARFATYASSTAPGDIEKMNAAIDVVLGFDEGSAGLETLLGEMANNDENDIAAVHNDVPFDLSAENLFFTHSAFPSLFLAYNNSAGTTPVRFRLIDATDTARLTSHYATYPGTLTYDEAARALGDFSDLESDHR